MVDEWEHRKIPPGARRTIVRDRNYARRLEQIDARTSRLLSHPVGRWLWQLYLAITLILCLPVIAIWLFLYGLVLAGWGFAFYLHLPIFIFMMALITLGVLVYRRFTISRYDAAHILLDRQAAPELYRALDEVAARLQAAPINIVQIQLPPVAGIRQRWTWSWRPHFDKVLSIGLMDLYALNVNQLKSVVAHEFGHIKQKDTLVLMLINQALGHLYDWTDPNNMGQLIAIVFFPVLIFLSVYYRMLVFVSRWAMRRQEYSADRIATQSYGKSHLQQALISVGAISIAFEGYLPEMMQKIDNDLDRRDFYCQFLDYWKNSLESTRQKYYANAVASFASVYDTHPSYQARRRALNQMDNLPTADPDDLPALSLLPNAAELGRELTVQLIRKARS